LVSERPVAKRYRLDSWLKQTDHEQTYLATDLAGGGVVVLRTATAALAEAVELRLTHEAALLSKLASSRLTPLLDFGREDDRFYWVRPHIPGISLAEHLRQPLPLEQALEICQQLLSALKELHSQSVLCRNLTPANVIIPEGQPLSAAILTDFGLGGSLVSEDIHQLSVQDVLYLSPEQAGSLDCEVSASSDLYSLGIVLFQLIAGHVPYQGPSVGAVLLRHMTSHIPKLRDLGWKVPRTLDEVLLRLLRKDPRDRYQSCDAVIADLSTIQQALQQGDRDPDFVIGLHDRRRTLTEAAFVGRTRELEQLDKQITHVRMGRPSFIVVETESGGGKTRLLDEVVQRGRRQGLWVLRGTGSNQIGLHPFQVLDGVLDGILASAGADPQLAENIRQRLGEQRDAICSALPRLATSLGWEISETLGPEAFGESRAIQALIHFLDALGEAGRPTLIVLDDCQWADESALKLITRWADTLAERHAQGANLALLVAFRSAEIPADALLRSLRPSLHLKLSKFEPDDIRRLLESMAGPLPEAIVQHVVGLADGSPFMASAVLRGLVESGALVADAEDWRVEPLALADLQSSHHAASFLSRRVELLPPEVVELLTVGAILGKEFDLPSAIHLAGQDPSAALRAVELVRERHLVWLRSSLDRCVFVHDKIRAIFLDRLTDEVRKDLHHRAARHLESHEKRNLFELAYHYDAADKSELALQFALEAAEQARLQHSLEIAEQQYRIAERGATTSDGRTQYRILQGLGDVLLLGGRYDSSAELF
jgi:two-component system sensor kinase